MTADNSRLRLGIVAVVAVSLFAALFARLWFLQVLTAGEHELAAERNQQRVIPLAAPRGRILDRDGAVLVANRASNVVTVDRSALARMDKADRDDLVQRLAAALDKPPLMLLQRLDDRSLGPFTPVPVAEDVPEDVLVELRERQAEFPGVEARQLAVRAYPFDTLAAHVLGYVGEINAEELKAKGVPYRPGSQIGKDGIESAFEADLRGMDGEVVLEVDARGNPVRQISRRDPVQGDDVVLSIDVEAQRTAEAALAQGMDRAPGDASAGASAVALDVKEGTVAAMASWPTFSPADFVYGIGSQRFAELNDPAQGTPFVNRAVQGQYAPGSTWKLVTAMAGLESGLITPETVVNDTGTYVIPNCSRGCGRRNAGGAAYGPVALSRALTVSSDVFFYSMGADLWDRREQFGETAIQDKASDLGFGTKTGVGLPSEAAGRLSTPGSRAQLNQQNPVAFPEGTWRVGDNVNLAIGQGELTVTPVQLANAYATFATGGTRYQPNLALRVQRQDGTLVRVIAPRIAAHTEIPAEVRSPILTGLVGVTQDPKGTAFNAFEGFPQALYPVAGKTGTAQVSGGKRDTALFAAIAPAYDPRYAVAVVMEQGGFGATSAAPVARRLLGTLSGVEQPTPVQLAAGRD
ncbi:MAG: penicillin-binding protein 2 [Acidimicrobiales bacterium]